MAAAATRRLGGFLFGVEAFDPLTFGAVAIVCLSVVAVAALEPALRAGRVDPRIALSEG